MKEGRLPTRKVEILKKSGIPFLHKEHIRVTDEGQGQGVTGKPLICSVWIVIRRLFYLQIKRLEKDFRDMPEIISFVKKALTVDSIERPTAQQLLDDKYLEVYF